MWCTYECVTLARWPSVSYTSRIYGIYTHTIHIAFLDSLDDASSQNTRKVDISFSSLLWLLLFHWIFYCRTRSTLPYCCSKQNEQQYVNGKKSNKKKKRKKKQNMWKIWIIRTWYSFFTKFIACTSLNKCTLLLSKVCGCCGRRCRSVARSTI